MAVTVPAQFQALVNEAAQGTGLPETVVAAQANDESGFNPNAVSPTGAEGWLQFEPGTYDNVAKAAGVQQGTEFNPDDETKAYIVYMNQLLQEEGGSIEKALEAYNAGPGDLAAGQGYAASILAAADEPANSTSTGGTGGTGASTTGLDLNPFNLFGIPSEIESGLGSAENSAYSAAGHLFEDVIDSAWQSFMNITGISGFKDFMVRVGLLLLGLILLIIGLVKLFDVHPVQGTVKLGKTAANDAIGGAVL
jgi:hypothetical protein